MSKPKKDKSNTIIYKLEICYNPDTDTIEYLKESLVDEEYLVTYNVSGFDIFDYCLIAKDDDKYFEFKSCF